LQRPGPLVLIALAYLVLASGVMIWRGISVSPDYLLIAMIPVALVSGRFFRFLGDWVPFVAIFLGWEAMRGIAPKTGIEPHVTDLAAVERFIFGGAVPSATLQSWLDHDALGTVLNYGATVVYFGHFAVPAIIGMVLWLADRTQFLRYTTALVGMCFAAFAIFLVLPTAPPWYAQDAGVINGVHKILGTTLPSAVSPYYQSLNPNPVAALPSLHAAFPFLGFLALRGVWPRAAWFALAWSAAVWFSVVYLGEHWAIDVVAGAAAAALSWSVLMRYVVPRVGALQSRSSLADLSEEDDGLSVAAVVELRLEEPVEEPTAVA
jgi:membrane-associated phospholipid phosphatase